MRFARFVAWSLLLSAGALAQVPFRQSGFAVEGGSLPAGWHTWAARSEIAPRTYVDRTCSRGEAGSLAVSGDSNASAYGGWERKVDGIEPGKWYRLTAWYRAEALDNESLQVLARLDWAGRGSGRAGQPDYAYRTTREGDWRRVVLEAPAPEKAAAVRIQLYLQNAPQATVWWDEIALEAVPTPAPRRVTIASVNFRPGKSTGSAEESVRQFVETADRVAPAGVDLIVLPEGVTVVDTGKKYADVAEPVPGPTTAKLGELARRKKAWIVAGLYEREGAAIYNTAVLISRDGGFAGRYRKIYIPREEIEAGITPGRDYPVFDTDFGRLGMMICWDVQYADPARGLALRGAEIIALPIWGGNQTLARARVIENRVFLAASGYDFPTEILDPNGEVIASAGERGTAAVTTIDLNRRYLDPWLGDMRGRFMKELRLDVPVTAP